MVKIKLDFVLDNLELSGNLEFNIQVITKNLSSLNLQKTSRKKSIFFGNYKQISLNICFQASEPFLICGKFFFRLLLNWKNWKNLRLSMKF